MDIISELSMNSSAEEIDKTASIIFDEIRNLTRYEISKIYEKLIELHKVVKIAEKRNKVALENDNKTDDLCKKNIKFFSNQVFYSLKRKFKNSFLDSPVVDLYSKLYEAEA